jgi:hypothetical protein
MGHTLGINPGLWALCRRSGRVTADGWRRGGEAKGKKRQKPRVLWVTGCTQHIAARHGRMSPARYGFALVPAIGHEAKAKIRKMTDGRGQRVRLYLHMCEKQDATGVVVLQIHRCHTVHAEAPFLFLGREERCILGRKSS